MNRSKITMRQWVVIGLAGYLIIIALLYVFLLRPTFNELEKVKTEATTAEEHFLLDAARQAVNTFRRRLIKADELGSLRAEIINLGRKNDIQSLSVEPMSSEKDVGGRLVSVPFKLRFQGSFHNIGVFVSGLERSEKLSFVGNLDIQKRADSDNRHQAEFTLYAFKSAK